MIVPGMQIPATEFGLSPFAKWRRLREPWRRLFLLEPLEISRSFAPSNRSPYFVERPEASFSTNNCRKRNTRGRFNASLLDARLAQAGEALFLPSALRIFIRTIAVSTPHATSENNAPAKTAWDTIFTIA